MNPERESANQLAELLDDFRTPGRLTAEERDFLRLRERLQTLAADEGERASLAQRTPAVRLENPLRRWRRAGEWTALAVLLAATILIGTQLSGSQTKEAHPSAVALAPEVCPGEEPGQQSPPGYPGLGGGEVQSGDFSIQLWLTCDSRYSRTLTDISYYSEIDGLAVYYSWAYNGEKAESIRDITLNIEPYRVTDRIPIEFANLQQGVDYSGAAGLNLPTGVFPDWKAVDAHLRMVLKFKLLDGSIEGAALTFTLKRAADGFIPQDIAVEPLNGAERTSIEGNAVTEPPFPLIPIGDVYPELKELEGLLARRNQELTAGGGWIHAQIQVFVRPEQGGGMQPEGSPIHYWWLFDPAGTTIAFASGWWDAEDELYAYTIYNGIVHRTDVLGSENGSEEGQDYVIPAYSKFEGNSLTWLIESIKRGYSIESTHAVKDGRPVLVLNIIPPNSEAQATQPVSIMRVYYDAETGVLIYMSEILENGGEIENERIVIEEERVAQPPKDILELFAEPLPSFGSPPDATEQFHISGTELWKGPRLVADVCSGSAMDDQPQVYERLGIGNLNGTLLGGGQLDSGDFLFDAWLVCDFQYENYPNAINSEISGLAVALKWTYNGAPMEDAIVVYAGMEPYIREVGYQAPVEVGQSGVVFKGFTVPELVLPDWNVDEIPLRYVVKAELPGGSLAGVAIRLTLRREEQGFRPLDIVLEPLSDFERSATTAGDVSEPPFALLDLDEVYPDLADLHALLMERENGLLSGAGWIHTVTQITSDDTSLARRLVWGNFSWDSWYQVDEQGFILAQVIQAIAADGRLLQQSVLKDGRASNLNSAPQLNIGLARYDAGGGLLPRLLLAMRFGQPAERTLETINGREAWVFTFTDERDTPIDRGEYMVYGSVTRKAVDAQTGAYLFETTQYFDLTGSPLVFDEWAVTIEERVAQAPEAILDLLANPPGEYQPIPPGGTPAAAGADFSNSDLIAFLQPNNDREPFTWLADIYSGDTYLGRVDMGLTSDGSCVRSATGSKMAIRYETGGAEGEIRSTLRWFDVNDVSRVHEPAPGLMVTSGLTWSPWTNELAFTACDADGLCGLYVLDAQSDEVRRLADAEANSWNPLWKPDGSQVAVVGAEEKSLLVVDAANGAEIHRGVYDSNQWNVYWGVDFTRNGNEGNCFAEKTW